VRKWMIRGKLWHADREKVKQVHVWRPRRSRCGELVQWDTSEHDWLEGRGEKLYLIAMIDDATSRLFARFVRHDSTEENMKLLRSYLETFGRPLAFYTDKASIFQTAGKRKRDEPGADKDPVEMPPTQIGRALQELGITWIAAHSPQAKGRVERNFGTAQDRLVKGMRVAGVKTIEQANEYLTRDYLAWWERELTVEAASSDDAHRPLDKSHNLAASLSHVETRQVRPDYTLRWDGRLYQSAQNLAGGGGVGTQRGRGTLIGRKWREGKVPPFTGKLSARPAGKPGFLREREDLQRFLLRDRDLNTQALRMRFSRHGGIYLVRSGFPGHPPPRSGTVPPPAGRPRVQVAERGGRTTFHLIVRR